MSNRSKKKLGKAIEPKDSGVGTPKNTSQPNGNKALTLYAASSCNAKKLDESIISDFMDNHSVYVTRIHHYATYYFVDEGKTGDFEYIKECGENSRYYIPIKSQINIIDVDPLCDGILLLKSINSRKVDKKYVDVKGREFTFNEFVRRGFIKVEVNDDEVRNYVSLFCAHCSDGFDVMFSCKMEAFELPIEFYHIVAADPNFRDWIKSIGYNPYHLVNLDKYEDRVRKLDTMIGKLDGVKYQRDEEPTFSIY